MRRRTIQLDPEEQGVVRAQVLSIIAGGATYDEIREGLQGLGFQAKEDNPALGIWENHEYDLFVLVRMDRETGRLQEFMVKTFEEMEGF
jgi:hypothetical protein